MEISEIFKDLSFSKEEYTSLLIDKEEEINF